jgi:hypothetical protein
MRLVTRLIPEKHFYIRTGSQKEKILDHETHEMKRDKAIALPNASLLPHRQILFL